MAQSGYTPIKLYYSTTATAVPSSGNLVDGELALNIADMKLYAKNSSGAVTLLASSTATGTVSSVSVVSANGLAGTVANATSTPAITLSTSITGVLKGNGTAISAAVSGTDYAPATSGTSILKGNGSGGFSNATSGTDYAPATSGTSILYGNGSGGFSNVTIGTNLTFAGGTLSVSGGGAPTTTTYTNQSSNVTLTSSDANTLISFTLANDITVTMPNATTLSSAKNFILKNNSTVYGIIINDAAGNYLFALPPRAGMYFWTTSTATSAGAWVTQNIPLPYVPLAGTNVSRLLSGVYPASVRNLAPLSSTTAVVVLGGYSQFSLCVATVSGGVVTFGDQVAIPMTAPSAYCVGIAALSATNGIFVWNYSSNSTALRPHAYGFSVSGTTITLGAQVDLSSGSYTNVSTNWLGLTAMSSTDATLVYNLQTTVYAQNLSLSGNTVSIVGPATAFTSACGDSVQLGCQALTATTALVSTTDSGGNGYPTHFVITNSGGTYTKGTSVTNAATNAGWMTATVLSPTLFVSAFFNASSDPVVQAGSISGTTITLGTANIVINTIDCNYVSITGLSSTTAMLFYNYAGNSISSRIITVSGTTCSAGSVYTANSITGASYLCGVALQAPNLAAPSSSSVLFNFWNDAAGGPYFQNLTVSGGVITANSTYMASSTIFDQQYCKKNMAALSDTQFILLENIAPTPAISSGARAVTARLYSVSGSTPVLQSTVTIANDGSNGGNYDYFSIVPLTSTSAIVTYAQVTTGYIYSAVLTVSGSTLSAGSVTSVEAGTACTYSALCRISNTQAIVYYNGSGSSGYVRSLNVSGTTISVSARDTYNFATIFSASTLNTCEMAAISTTYAVLAVQSNSPSAILIGIDVSGSSATFNAFAAVIFGNAYKPSLVALSSTQLLLAYGNAGTSNYYLRMLVIQMAGDGRSFGGQYGYIQPGRAPASSSPFYPYLAVTKSANGITSGVVNLNYTNNIVTATGFWQVKDAGVALNIPEETVHYSQNGQVTQASQICAMQTPALLSPNANSVVSYYLSIPPTGLTADAYSNLRKTYLTGAVN